jgi:hypothetical protein
MKESRVDNWSNIDNVTYVEWSKQKWLNPRACAHTQTHTNTHKHAQTRTNTHATTKPVFSFLILFVSRHATRAWLADRVKSNFPRSWSWLFVFTFTRVAGSICYVELFIELENGQCPSTKRPLSLPYSYAVQLLSSRISSLFVLRNISEFLS